MTNALVEYWKAFETSLEGLNIHPADREWFQAASPTALLQRTLKNHGEYVGSNLFGEDKGLHLSLLPIPYIGNLADADIIIFLQNPGFSIGDYHVEEDPTFRDLAHRNLRQQRIADYPFIYLNPRFAWCSGFQWWEARFRPIIRSLMNDKGWGYHKALAEISCRIAAVELFPYHSADASSLGTTWHTMPSAKQARTFLSSIAAEPQKLKLIMRSHNSWKGPTTYPKSDHFHESPRTRGVTFNCDLETNAGEAGKRILSRLRNVL